VLAKRLQALLPLAGLPTGLRECQVERAELPRLAEEAAQQWTATFNPRPITAADFARLYEQAWK
jgi:alcohol dehydrogenase